MSKKLYSAPTAKKSYSSPAIISNTMKYFPIHKRDLKYYSSESNFTDKRVKSSGLGISTLLAFIVVILLFAVLFRISTGQQNYPTFYSFLDTLTNAPSIEMSFDLIKISFGEWVINTSLFTLDFNWFRDFVRLLVSSLNFLAWLGVNVVNCLTYIFYFFRWLFIG